MSDTTIGPLNLSAVGRGWAAISTDLAQGPAGVSNAISGTLGAFLGRGYTTLQGQNPQEAYDAQNPAPPGSPTTTVTFSPTTTGFSHWALGFVVVAAVLLVTDEDDQWAPLARGFAWLAVVGLVFTQWPKLTAGAQAVWK